MVSSASRQRRLSWLDVAKGGAVILVALFHSTFYLDGTGLVHAGYGPLNDILVQLRMPTFFLASGITTSFLLSRARDEYVARKILPLVWILLVWSFLRDIVLLQFDPFSGDPSTGVGHFVHNLLLSPNAGMWFVWSIAVLSILAVLVRGVPWVLTVAVALAASILVSTGRFPVGATPLSSFLVENFLTYAYLFFVGVGLAALFTDIGASGRRAAALFVLGGLGFVAANAVDLLGDGDRSGASAALRITFGALFGLATAMLVDRVAPLGRWMCWAGRRSLGIYVGHSLFMFWIVRLAPDAWIDGLAATAAGPVLSPVLLTAISVAGALLLNEALVRARLGWLYVLPPDVGRRIVALARAPRPATGR